MFKIVYLCHIYPWVTQTFVFNEIEGLKANRVPLQVVVFKRPTALHVALLTPEMQAAMEQACYLPPIWSLESLRSQLANLARHPRRYLQTFWQVLTGPYMRLSSFKLRLQSILDFLRGVQLGTFLDREKCSHLHAEFPNHSATSAWVAHKLTGIPFSFRSYTSNNPQLIHRKVSDATFVLACSEYDRQLLLSWSDQCYAEKIIVNVLGIDVAQWQANEKIEEKPGLIVCVGTLAEKKGQEFLIRACAFLKDQWPSLQALLVGDGPDRERLQDLIKTLGIQDRVQITGYRSHHEVQRLMQQAAVFCLPCIVSKHGDTDGIPFVLMEAMALGKATVSTPISGIPELIRDGQTGLLVPEQDVEALADAIARLLSDSELRIRLGTAAREKVEIDFNIHLNVKKLVSLF